MSKAYARSGGVTCPSRMPSGRPMQTKIRLTSRKAAGRTRAFSGGGRAAFARAVVQHAGRADLELELGGGDQDGREQEDQRERARRRGAACGATERMPTPRPRNDASRMKLVKYDRKRTWAGIQRMHSSSAYRPRKLVRNSWRSVLRMPGAWPGDHARLASHAGVPAEQRAQHVRVVGADGVDAGGDRAAQHVSGRDVVHGATDRPAAWAACTSARVTYAQCGSSAVGARRARQAEPGVRRAARRTARP